MNRRQINMAFVSTNNRIYAMEDRLVARFRQELSQALTVERDERLLLTGRVQALEFRVPEPETGPCTAKVSTNQGSATCVHKRGHEELHSGVLAMGGVVYWSNE